MKSLILILISFAAVAVFAKPAAKTKTLSLTCVNKEDGAKPAYAVSVVAKSKNNAEAVLSKNGVVILTEKVKLEGDESYSATITGKSIYMYVDYEDNSSARLKFRINGTLTETGFDYQECSKVDVNWPKDGYSTSTEPNI